MTNDENIQKMDDEEHKDDKKDEEAKKAEDDKEDKKEEDKEKSNSLIETLKGLTSAIESIDSKVEKLKGDFDNRLKAMETPTDFPAKPAITDEEDIGAKTQAPNVYQSNSEQAGIDDSDPENSLPKDKEDLKMQEKGGIVNKASPEHTYTTSTPRSIVTPSERIENIVKSSEGNPILKDARAVGFEGLSMIAKDITKGKYYVPNENEVSFY